MPERNPSSPLEKARNVLWQQVEEYIKSGKLTTPEAQQLAQLEFDQSLHQGLSPAELDKMHQLQAKLENKAA